jgi:hypothetical protein
MHLTSRARPCQQIDVASKYPLGIFKFNSRAWIPLPPDSDI